MLILFITNKVLIMCGFSHFHVNKCLVCYRNSKYLPVELLGFLTTHKPVFVQMFSAME